MKNSYIKKFCLILLFTCGLAFSSWAQGKFILQDNDWDRINFKFINNLIVIPVEVNGVELSFLLDTGVSKPIVFNFLNLTQELKINQTEKIYLRGLGEGESVEALRSRNNIFKIGEALSISQDLYAIFDPALNFAPQLGVAIHGIIGYDLFKDFVVEINYSKKYLKLHDPETYIPKKCKKCETYGLDFFNNKPYINAEVKIAQDIVPVKLLIDSGGSDALWLFEDVSKNINIPAKNYQDFLGRGLSGSLYGKRAKIESMSFGDFSLKRVNTAFPDSTSIVYARNFKERNGSVGGEVLKRFNIIIDYKNNRITLKKNGNFNSPFYYNKSGIVLEHHGVRVVKERDTGVDLFKRDNNVIEGGSRFVISKKYRYVLSPAFVIVELRENSPAKRIGLKVGDVILNINNKDAHNYSLQEVIHLFYGEDGKRVSVLIDRNGIQMKFRFKLEPLL